METRHCPSDYGLPELIDRVRPSLVEVRARRGGRGSGVVWPGDGLVVTNAHVVRGEGIRIRLSDGRTLPARHVDRDLAHDLAVLRIEADDLYPCCPGDSDGLRPGEWVFALGHPWGVPGALTAGVVIGTGGEWFGRPREGKTWIFADLHLRPGNSGGPLCDAEGRVVGINTMVTGYDMGVAVPVRAVHRFLDRL